MRITHAIPLSTSNLLAWQLMRLQHSRNNNEPETPQEKPEAPKPNIKPEMPPPPQQPEVKPEIIPPSQKPEIPTPPNPLPGSILNFHSYR